MDDEDRSVDGHSFRKHQLSVQKAEGRELAAALIEQRMQPNFEAGWVEVASKARRLGRLYGCLHALHNEQCRPYLTRCRLLLQRIQQLQAAAPGPDMAVDSADAAADYDADDMQLWLGDSSTAAEPMSAAEQHAVHVLGVSQAAVQRLHTQLQHVLHDVDCLIDDCCPLIHTLQGCDAFLYQ